MRPSYALLFFLHLFATVMPDQIQDPLQSKAKAVRSAGLLGIVTFISRALGLVREVFVAALLGTSIFSDAFTLAFSIPDLFRRLFAEGTLVSVFIPSLALVKKRDGPAAASEFAGSLMTLLTVTIGLFCLLAIFIAPLIIRMMPVFDDTAGLLEPTLLLVQIMFAYILFISLTSVYQGILNSFSIFWVSSLTPVLLNLSVISFATLLSPCLENPAIGFAIGIIVGGMLQLAFHVPFVNRLPIKPKFSFHWKNPTTRSVFAHMLPSIFGIGIYQINIVIGNIVAFTLPSGSISSLKFSNRLLEFALGVFVVSITTIVLPRFSVSHMEKKQDDFQAEIGRSMNFITLISLPIVFGGFLLAEEIITLLYSRGQFDNSSIALTTSAFRFHLLGLVFIAWNRMFLICYQTKSFIKPMVQAGAWILVLNLSGALLLKAFMGHNGIALASSISQLAHTVLLVFFLRNLSINKAFNLVLNRSTIQSIIASLLMLFGLLLFDRMSGAEEWWLPLRVVSHLAVGCGIYFCCLYLQGNKSLKELIVLIQGKSETRLKG